LEAEILDFEAGILGFEAGTLGSAKTRPVKSPLSYRRSQTRNHLERSLRRMAVPPAEIQSVGNQMTQSPPSADLPCWSIR